MGLSNIDDLFVACLETLHLLIFLALLVLTFCLLLLLADPHSLLLINRGILDRDAPLPRPVIAERVHRLLGADDGLPLIAHEW